MLKGASGEKEQPPGAMMALTFLAYLWGQGTREEETERKGEREREREREKARVNTSREGFHEERGDRFATPRFSAGRRLAVAGGGMLVLQGWKQQTDI